MRIKFLSGLALTVLSSALLSHVGLAKDKIFVVSSYHADYQWDMDYKKGLEDGLGGKWDLEWFYLDTKRLAKDKHEAKGNEAWAKYEAMKPKPYMVILGDDASLKFLGPKLEKEGKTPVVYLGINRTPRDYVPDGKNLTGILERPLLTKSLAEIKSTLEFNKLPIKKVLVLFDNDRTSEASVEQAFAGKTKMSFSGIETDVKLIGKFDAWKEEINNLEKNGYDAVVIGLYQSIHDAQDKPVNPDTVLEWTAANVKKPPFAFWTFAVGKGRSLGGLVLYGKDQGTEAAKMILEIAGGADITKIRPRIGEKGQHFFSKSEVAKWKIKLPPAIEKDVVWVD